MKINKVSMILVIGLINLMEGCAVVDKFESLIKQKEPEIEHTISKKRTVSFACGQEGIKEYLGKGWQVIDTKEKDIPCTWKTEKANSRCDIDKDKGCRITVPDKIGKEYTYTIEKDIELKVKDN